MKSPRTLHRVPSSIRGTAVILACIFAVPLLTANASAQTDLTSESMPHSADSYYSESFMPNNISDNALGLYDNVWHSADVRQGVGFPHWIRIDLGTAYVVQQLNILAYTDYDGIRLKEFWFEGSNDGAAFTPLHGTVRIYDNVAGWQTFLFSNTVGYRYYRLRGLNNWAGGLGASQMIIEEWEMFGELPVSVVNESWGAIKALYR